MLYGYVTDPNTLVDLFGLKCGNKTDFIVTPNGTAMPTNQDYDLVSTQKSVEEGGGFIQIHNSHEHKGVSPHTHTSQVNTSPTGITSTNRVYNPTSAADIDAVDEALRDGSMRQRSGRGDTGGPR